MCLNQFHCPGCLGTKMENYNMSHFTEPGHSDRTHKTKPVYSASVTREKVTRQKEHYNIALIYQYKQLTKTFAVLVIEPFSMDHFKLTGKFLKRYFRSIQFI